MIQIAITAAAFEAIADTLPLGIVGYEVEANTEGERQVWIDRTACDKLARLRGPGESYSDVILRLVQNEARGA
jgi:hypothetical protein